MPSAINVLLAVHCKRTDQIDIKTPVLTYIRATYNDTEADEAVDDLAAIQGLRNELVTAQSGNQGVRKEALIKYYKSLTAIETRFPISGERGHVKLSFPWYDAFKSTKKASQSNIHFEKAAVLFNLAAVLSQNALQVERGTADGLTQACKLFQESAGMFSHLRDAEANKVDAPRPVDLTPECCTMMEKLMMAQAQECVYHKAVLDKKSPGVVARLAKQAATMYGEASALFNSAVLATHFDKNWVSHTLMKSSLMDVLALEETGKQYNSETKISKEISVLSEAFTRLQATKKLAQAISADMASSLKPMEEGMYLALTKAQKDNNAIYLEKVPPFADLPQVQGACLVKPAPPTNLDASTENLFSSLVPDSSAKALSKYTDMVDSRVREVLDKLAGATDAARVALRQAELPDLLEAMDGATPSAAVPEAVMRELEEVQGFAGSAHLRGILAEIGDLRRNVEADMAACQKALDEEATADAAARNEYGDKWKVPQSATLARHLWEKIGSYRSTMTQAGESDAKVIQRLQDNEAAFQALAPEAAAAQMPRLQAPLVPMGPEDPAVVVASLRRGMETLSALSTERAGIEEAMKEAKAKDNILPKLMASPSSGYDALFDREISKYDKMRDDATASVARNDEVLAQITQDAQAFRSVFQVNAWRASCEAATGGIRSSLKTYREVLDHLSEGLRFYMSLQEAVKSHLQQCTDFAFTRALQRDEMKQDLQRAAREERDAKAAATMSYLAVNPPQQQPAYPPQAPPPAGYAPYHAPQYPAQQPQYPPPGVPYSAPAAPPPPPVPQPYHGYPTAGHPPPQQPPQQHGQHGQHPQHGQQQPQYGQYGGYQQPPQGQQQYVGYPPQHPQYAYPPGQQPQYPPYPPQSGAPPQ